MAVLADRVEYTYNRLGEVIEKKDQNGTVHQYARDGRGRPTADKITTLGAGVDGAVRRIARTYEVRGMVEKITSYDAASGGNAVNEVLFEYDSLGLVTKEYQEHAGAKGGNTPYVGYSYDASASGGQFTKALRPTSLRYPNGRLVHSTYGSSGSSADALHRIAAIHDDDSGTPGSALAEYSYLGQGHIVQVDCPEPDLRFDLAHGGGSDPYEGPLDRFGELKGSGVFHTASCYSSFFPA
ncbi:MAG: hypothetical protein ACOY3P_22265 [Planctomycetota bacterium]